MSFNINSTAQGFATLDNAGTLPSSVSQSFQSIDGREQSEPKSGFTSGNTFKQKYNEILHNIELYLDNSGNFDSPQRYFINPAAVLGMTISDTVNDWVASGAITFMYLPEGTPNIPTGNGGQKRKTSTSGRVEEAARQNGKALESYEFRGDGFDLLRLIIVPESAPGEKGDGIKIDKNDTKWTLSYLFSIYDIEDVNNIPGIQGPLATYMKCIRLKFHDVRYQILKTTNLEYSTANSPDVELVEGLANGVTSNGTPRALKTGTAMLEILNEALSKPEYGGSYEFSVSPGISWDTGSSSIFYTSPAQYTAFDDLEYVYAHHVSSKSIEGVEGAQLNDLCLLHTERATSYGLIEPLVLTPLTDFFEKAGNTDSGPGELQKEHFFVTSHTDQEETPAAVIHRAPMGGNGKDVDLKTFKYGQIISYSFVDMSPEANSTMFNTTPVYSVDIGKRQFNIQFQGNDVLSARKAISKSYISKLYKKGTDEEQLFLPTLHQTKKDRNVFPTFTLNGDNEIVRQKNGFHNLLYTGLFQNACICFKTYGLTLRESGTFIGIDKVAGCADNDYNNKLYGQWFVVKVDHLFEAGSYMNVIYAVKLHRFKEKESRFDKVL